MTGRTRLAAYVLALGAAGVAGAGLGAAVGPDPTDRPADHAPHTAPATGEHGWEG